MWIYKQVRMLEIIFFAYLLLASCSAKRQNSMLDIPMLSQTEDISFVKPMSRISAIEPNVHGVIGSDSRVTSQFIRSQLEVAGVRKVEALDLGVYGKLGSTSIFVADRSLIPTYDRLYWAMVRILSEKYGCFIRRKIDFGDVVSFKCRDHRTVTMVRKISGKFSLIHVRQHDRDGRAVVTSGSKTGAL